MKRYFQDSLRSSFLWKQPNIGYFMIRTAMMDVTRKKVKNWAEDPEWHCCAEGSIGPVSASKQVLLTSMRGLGWLQAVMVPVFNEFMKRELHIGTSSISLILQMTAVEGLLWYSNNTVISLCACSRCMDDAKILLQDKILWSDWLCFEIPWFSFIFHVSKMKE